MKIRKAALAFIALALATPLLLANPIKDRDHEKHKHEAVAVPEGGSTLAYLLISGTIAGYALLRKRRSPESN
jgi:hypothetical protein